MISKFINTGSFSLIILCFLLPFVSIKCNDTTLVEFKGYDLIIGKDYSIKKPTESLNNINKNKTETDNIGTEQKERLKTNWFMVLLLISSVAGLIFSLTVKSKKRVFEIASAAVGLISLILMVAILGNKLESKADLGNNMMGLEIRLGYEVGFWIILLLLIAIIIYNSVLIVLDSQKKIDPSSPLNDYEPPPSIDKIE